MTQETTTTTTTKLNIDIPRFGGFYDSLFDSELSDILEHIFNDSTKVDSVVGEWIQDNITDYIDYTNYKEDVAKKACEVLENQVNGFFMDKTNKLNLNVEFVKIDSPRFYNYTTDKIICSLEYNESALLECINNNHVGITNQLKEDFTSCDGFTSFVVNTLEDCINSIKNNGENKTFYVESILGYILDCELNDSFDMCVWYEVESHEESYYKESELVEAINKEFKLDIKELSELEK